MYYLCGELNSLKDMGGKGSGGARDRAGRQPVGEKPTVKLTITVPAEMADELRRDAKFRNYNLSEYIRHLIDRAYRR